jgi:hypothetical protein
VDPKIKLRAWCFWKKFIMKLDPRNNIAAEPLDSITSNIPVN